MRDKQTEIDIWHSAELKADLIRGRFVDYAYDVHTHETACFALITSGSIRIKMKGHEFVARKNDLYAIDADVPHAGWATDASGWTLRTLYVDMENLNRIVREKRAAHGAGITGPIISDPLLGKLLYDMHTCSELHGARLLQEQSYLLFADKLIACHTGKRGGESYSLAEARALNLAREYLDAHLGDTVSLHDIAAQTGLPVYRLFRAFSRAYGMTPHEYQRQARVRYTMRLIRSNHALAEAGAMAGFTDQAHFTRWFRRIMGVTPGQYQNAYR